MKSYFLLAIISLLFTSQAYAIDPEQMQKLTQVFSDVGRINKALEIESKKRTGEIRGPGKENFVGEKIDTGECTTEFKNNGSVEAGDSKFILFDFLISGAACPFRIQINVVGEQVSEGAIKVAYSMKSDFPNQDMQTDAKFRSINMIGDIGVKVENKGNEIVQSFDVSIEMSGEHIEEGHLSLRNTFKGDIKIILPFGLGGQLGEEIKASLPGIKTVLKSNVDFASQSETYTQDDRNITKKEYEEIRKSLQLPFDPGEKEDGTLECDIKFWRAEQVSMSQLQQAIDQGQEIPLPIDAGVNHLAPT